MDLPNKRSSQPRQFSLQALSLTPRWDSISNLTLAWPVGPNELCREGGGGALVGGKFRAYSAAKAAGYAFRPFILRIRHAQGPGGISSTPALRWPTSPRSSAICK